MIDVRWTLGDDASSVERLLSDWTHGQAVRRLWERDTTLWSSDPATAELADRLGWLDLPETSVGLLPDLARITAEVPFWMTDLVLLGMGGSSLAPEVLARTIGGEGLPLTVMDSTHPQAVRDLAWINPANTIFAVASKSGTTLETLSLFRHFWSRTQEVTGDPGDHFIAITDPGSSLSALARERQFRGLFEAPPDVGGRFSALGPFGLVPAALMGIDAAALLAGAGEVADVCREPADHNPGLRLGAALAALAGVGRDKVTFITSSCFEAFPDWAEQLIAESTGKDGVGIIPVVHEPPLDVDEYGPDRMFVGIISSASMSETTEEWGGGDDALGRLDELEAAGHPVIRVEVDDEADLGGLFFLWEVAIAMAGAALGIHPFNQPDVQLAKQLARDAMSRDRGAGPPDPPGDTAGSGEDEFEGEAEIDLAWEVPPYGHANAGTAAPDLREMQARVSGFLGAIEPGDYVGIQVYLSGGGEDELEALQRLRAAITRSTGATTTLGYGPRFLHSTGQLHKGGPPTGAFLQLVDDAAVHVHVPETDFTFRQVIRAQALGDLEALEQRGRRVLRARVGPTAAGISRLIQLVEDDG